MIGKTILHYKILSKLGEGGMGVVYKAEDTKLDREVAIKFLPRQIAASIEEKRRFKIEAKAAAALNHANIATIHNIEEVDDETFIIMECIEGQELKEIVQTKQLDVATVIDYASQIAEGLKAAHDKDIIHRDIKSANVMITGNGRVKIMDFGLAKMHGGAHVTKVGTTLGTAAYMSPEQARGEEADSRSDIWSFGVVFYEMLTGRLPFGGDYEQAVVYSIVNEEPQPISELRPDVPPELVTVTKRTLAKNVSERYQSASELLDGLNRCTRNGSGFVSIQSMRLAPAKAPAFRWNRQFWGLVAGMLTVILLGALFPPTNRLVRSLFGLTDIPVQKHLLILPLTNVGGEAQNQAFCDGVMETLTSNLTQMEQFHGALWVVPASEVRKAGIESASEAHRAFGVNLVVTGSLQRIYDRFRLTLNLVDAKNLRQLSSSVIDNPISNLSVLQDQTVMKMAQMLNVELQPQTRELLVGGGTTFPKAYESYLKGLGYLQRRYEKTEHLDTAIDLFKEAIEQDSSYALAYSGLGEAYWRKYEAINDASLVEPAVINCQRAIELNNLLVPVSVTLGLIRKGTGQYDAAIEEFQRALTLDPASAEAYIGLASAYESQGRLDDAEWTYKRAIDLKPSYWAGYNYLGVFYYRYGRYEEAVQEFRQVIELVPQSAKGYRNLGAIYFFLNRNVEAIQMWKRSLELEPNYATYSNLATLYYYEERYSEAARMYEKALEFNDLDYVVWGNLASAYYWAPRERHKSYEAYRRAADLAEEIRKVNPSDPEVLVDLAGYYSVTLDTVKALALLQQVVASNPDQLKVLFRIGTTYEDLGKRELALLWIGKALGKGYSLAEIERNPELRDLREDARFKRLLRKHGREAEKK